MKSLTAICLVATLALSACGDDEVRFGYSALNSETEKCDKLDLRKFSRSLEGVDGENLAHLQKQLAEFAKLTAEGIDAELRCGGDYIFVYQLETLVKDLLVVIEPENRLSMIQEQIRSARIRHGLGEASYIKTYYLMDKAHAYAFKALMNAGGTVIKGEQAKSVIEKFESILSVKGADEQFYSKVKAEIDRFKSNQAITFSDLYALNELVIQARQREVSNRKDR